MDPPTDLWWRCSCVVVKQQSEVSEVGWGRRGFCVGSRRGLRDRNGWQRRRRSRSLASSASASTIWSGPSRFTESPGCGVFWPLTFATTSPVNGLDEWSRPYAMRLKPPRSVTARSGSFPSTPLPESAPERWAATPSDRPVVPPSGRPDGRWRSALMLAATQMRGRDDQRWLMPASASAAALSPASVAGSISWVRRIRAANCSAEACSRAGDLLTIHHRSVR